MSSQTCAYVASKDDPERWHGEDPSEFWLDNDPERGGLGISEWRCPHPPLGEEDSDEECCVFHTETEVPADRQREELLDALDDAGEGPWDDRPEHRGQFVGATFRSIDLSGETIAATADHDIRFDHALFQASDGGVNFTNDRSVNLNKIGIDFSNNKFVTKGQNNISFAGAKFISNGHGAIRFEDATFRTDGAGDVSFRDATFRTNSHGDVWFKNAMFRTDSGTVRFKEATFQTDSHGDVRFEEATFRTDSYGDVRFEDATFQTGSDGDGHVSFRDATFWGDEADYVRFKNATFRTGNDGNVRFNDATLTNADLQHIGFGEADFQGAKLTGTNIQEANVENVSVDGTTTCERLYEGYRRGPLTASSSFSTHLGRLYRGSNFDSEKWDATARAYHDLKTVFGGHGLVGKARNMHIRERRARSLEAKAARGRSNPRYLRSLPSRIFTGYGVQIWNLVIWMGALFLFSTVWYVNVGIRDTLMENVSYSVLAFTVAPPPVEAELGVITHLVIMIETFFGTLSIVLLGYILGNRERF